MLIKRILVIALIALATFISPGFAIAAPMPDGYPVVSDFAGSDLKTESQDWGVSRGQGRGGNNYGINLNIPEGNVLVSWDTRERSCISCVSDRVERLIFKQARALTYPAGIEVGVRIDTGSGIGGAGGSYTGTATYTYVPFDVWKEVYIAKYL